MALPDSPAARHASVAAGFSRIAAGTTDWSAPTPVDGWTAIDVVDHLMGELEQMPFDDERWGAKAKVMKENIEHHIEEEEGEMFRTARSIFSPDELRELADRMRAVRSNGGDKRA